MLWFMIILTIYLICAVIMYGKQFASFQKQWPDAAKQDYTEDMYWSILFGVFWFIHICEYKDIWKEYKKYGLLFY